MLADAMDEVEANKPLYPLEQRGSAERTKLARVGKLARPLSSYLST